MGLITGEHCVMYALADVIHLECVREWAVTRRLIGVRGLALMANEWTLRRYAADVTSQHHSLSVIVARLARVSMSSASFSATS